MFVNRLPWLQFSGFGPGIEERKAREMLGYWLGKCKEWLSAEGILCLVLT